MNKVGKGEHVARMLKRCWIYEGESLSHSVQPKPRNPRDVCIRVEGSSTNTVNGHHIIGGEPFLKFIRNKNVSEIAILQAISKDLAAMAEKNLKTL